MKEILGFNYHLDERADSELDSLNESINEIIKARPEFKSIKEVTFFIKDEDDSDSLSLMTKVHFRSGDSIESEFTSHVDKSAIELSRNELEAYFPKEQIVKIEKYLENGVLESEYLEAHEPQVFKSLSKIYLISLAPNTLNGAEFTSSDREFFLKIVQSQN